MKRSGNAVDYKSEKIRQVIFLCLVNGCGRPHDDDTKALAARVSTHVDRIIQSYTDSIPVEKIQDLVEQQLMALGEHDAAKQYILYREEHRRLRESQPVDAELKAVYDEGMAAFTGTNRHVQVAQAFDKYSRYRYDLGRRETWPETVERVLTYAKKHSTEKGLGVTEDEWAELNDALYFMQASPSLRVVQMAGPPLDRCQVGVYNCAFQFIDSPRAMAEQLYILMQGTGAGFSVEAEHAVDKWPRVKRQRNHDEDWESAADKEVFVVPDTTEGWCDSVEVGVTAWLEGRDVEYDYSHIRPEGTLLKTKGGTASGPGPLKDLHSFARQRILARQGRRLRAIDIHDITCYIHRIVQMGGVRRASGISLSDLDDREMRDSKAGPFWEKNRQRNQANNSAVYESKPSPVEFMEEWLALAKSGTGERGIFNRSVINEQTPARRDVSDWVIGVNPCGEIYLRPREFCNLSIAIAKWNYTREDLFRVIRLATIWGTIQATMTDFHYIRGDWARNCHEERLLGVDLLGHMDCALLQFGAEGREELLRELRDHAVEVNIEWSKRFGIKPSKAVTCGKPAGNSSVLFDTSNKPHHGKWYIRRLRIKTDGAMDKVLKESGVPNAPDYDGSGNTVFDFPCRAPGVSPVLASDLTAIDQLENWKTFKVNYTEHNPSVTINVREHEWMEVGNWVYANWEIVGGLSFMPLDDHIYPLAPYEAITEEKYNELMAAFPDEIDWSKLTRYEKRDETTVAGELACSAGGCEWSPPKP
jgi:ribonucleoside-diphosphate reductase alpha chain